MPLFIMTSQVFPFTAMTTTTTMMTKKTTTSTQHNDDNSRMDVVRPNVAVSMILQIFGFKLTNTQPRYMHSGRRTTFGNFSLIFNIGAIIICLIKTFRSMVVHTMRRRRHTPDETAHSSTIYGEAIGWQSCGAFASCTPYARTKLSAHDSVLALSLFHPVSASPVAAECRR